MGFFSTSFLIFFKPSSWFESLLLFGKLFSNRGRFGKLVYRFWDVESSFLRTSIVTIIIAPLVEASVKDFELQTCSVQSVQLLSRVQLFATSWMQHARLPCPSPIPEAYSNSCPLSQRHHPTISSSVVPFSSCLQPFPPSGSFQMSQFFASGGQSIGVSASASVLPMNIQDWFPLGWTDWNSLLSKGL